VKAAGLRGYRGIEAYGRAGETAQQSADRIRAEVRKGKEAGDKCVLISRADGPYCRALAPHIYRLVNNVYPSTIVGHGVFGASRPDVDPPVVAYWEQVWALMPSGIMGPL